MVNEIISRAAASESFTNNPISQELLDELSSRDFLELVTIPYLAKSNLTGLYPAGSNVLASLTSDWADCLESGALKMFDETTVSFALSIELSNGTPVEAGIRRNERGVGRPWYMSYAPDPTRINIRRDNNSAQSIAVESETHLDAIPEPLEQAILEMASSSEYVNGTIPAHVASLLESYEGSFSEYVWVPARWREALRDIAGLNMDVIEFLNREWAFAMQNNCMRFFEDKVVFPISILRKDGTNPIEVSIKRSDRASEHPTEGSLPWFVIYVDNHPKTRANPKKALREWAWLGDIHTFLGSLANIALPERWDFEEFFDEEPRYAILRNYINYTFYRLQAQNKILIDEKAGVAAFNTGLVDRTYESIYACFSQSNQGLKWKFEAFCKAGSRGWGKTLVSTFNPLPERASYINRKEDLLFDTDSPLTPDTDHILLDNIDRLPREFLEEEMLGSAEALDLVAHAFDDELPENREMAFDELSDLIEENIKIRRRLKNRLDDAIELACKRAEWNFKTAVPAWYPTRDVMSLLLPLDLTDDDRPDVALVVELTESGAYIGQTILTMTMAYTNARLVCRPDSDWLNTSLKILVDEDEREDE